MSAESRAHVQTGPVRLAVQGVPTPATSDEDAFLRGERCGICRSDVE